MKVLTSVLTAVLPLFVAAHGDDFLQARRHYARQVPSSSSSSPSASSPTSAPSAAPSLSSSLVPSTTINGSVIAISTSTTHNITISPLLSTNPTAVPLSSIVSNQSSGTTLPLTTTEVPGSIPSYIAGAPPLPNVMNLNVANYPRLDAIPPTDSSEVLQWIKEVQETGVVIPDFPPTNPGGCPNNTAAVADPSRCWWTCTGCTASYDVTECPQPMAWGLTYDDGPAYHTTQLLSYLAQNDLQSTFFVVGSRILQFPHIAQDEYMTGHQIAVHTWSHPYLTTLTNEQIIAELGWSKKVIKDALGVTPNMFRPPYGDIDQRVRAIAVAMGLQPVIWTRLNPKVTFDTGDFNVAGGTTSSFQVIQNWENIINNATTMSTGFIVLEHDLFPQAVELAVGYILPDALAFKPPFNITPVISCLNMPFSNAYIETNDNVTNPPLISGSAVTIIHPTATGTGGGSSSSAAHFGIDFRPMFLMTVITLLAGAYTVFF